MAENDNAEYYAIKWHTDECASRKTKEVDLICKISSDGKSIVLSGTADLRHHLVEDSAILLKKMCDHLNGEHSI